MNITLVKRKGALIIGVAIVLFNLWHLSSRPFWVGSVMNSIGLGPNTIELARQTFPDVEIRRPYDGQFYFAMAHDPLLISGKSLPYIDVPNYRYRRMLYPLLAWMLSFGNPTALPAVLFVINVLAWLLCGGAAWRIAREERMPAALAVTGIVGLTGLQFAAFRTLSEPLALSLILWGIWFLKKEKPLMGSLLLGAACLARETSVVAFVTTIGYFFWKKPDQRKTLAIAAVIALLPAITWSLYVPKRVEKLIAYFAPVENSMTGGVDIVWPMTGFVRETKIFLAQEVTRHERRRTASISIFTLILMSLSVFLIWSRRSLWAFLALAEAAFCSVVQGNVWDYYAGSSRVIINLTAFVLLGFITTQISSSQNKTP